MIAGLERDVDGAAVRGAPVRRGGPTAEHGLDRVERGAVAAGARERDREVVLGVLVLDEVVERVVAGRLHDRVQRDRGGQERAVAQQQLADRELVAQGLEVAGLDVDELHALERREVLRQRIGCLRGLRLRLRADRACEPGERGEQDEREALHFLAPFALFASPASAVPRATVFTPMSMPSAYEPCSPRFHA